jgi:ribosomal protein S18 acetylase RimI-like enzyme
MIVRRVASLLELRLAWELVARILRQDESHPRNYGFYAEQFRRYPDLLVVAYEDSVSTTPPVAAAGSGGSTFGAPPVSGTAAAGEDPFAGGLVGALLAHAGPGYVHVGKLAVTEGQRGRGVGTALLREVERAAAAVAHRPRLTLGADPNAVPFYVRHGYRSGILLQQTGEDSLDRLQEAARRHLPEGEAGWSTTEDDTSTLLVLVDTVDPAALSQLRAAVPGGSVYRMYTKSL